MRCPQDIFGGLEGQSYLYNNARILSAFFTLISQEYSFPENISRADIRIQLSSIQARHLNNWQNHKAMLPFSLNCLLVLKILTVFHKHVFLLEYNVLVIVIFNELITTL